MTISSSTNKVQYNGSGTTGPFAFAFKTFASGDLTIIKTDAVGVETTLVLTTDYTVSLNGDQNNNPGGTVTTVAGVASGYKLTIVREVDALQETDITNGGGFYPEVIENALDRLTMLVQQVDEVASRAITVPVSSSATPTEALDAILAEAQADADAAASSAAAAATSVSDCAVIYDAFDDRYLGAKTSAPTLDNDGAALISGALYWNSSSSQMYAWSGTEWIVVSSLSDFKSDGTVSMTGDLDFATAKNISVGGSDIIAVTSSGAGPATGKTLEATSGPSGSAFGFRNKIINGGMAIAQRSGINAQVNLTATATYQTADRWAVYQSGTANGYSKATSYAAATQPAGFSTSLLLVRNAGATTTGDIAMVQVLETENSFSLRGTTATLSFYALAGANFSAAGSLVGVTVFTGTGVDQTLAQVLAGSWTGQASTLDTTQAVTTGWVRYSFQVSIPSETKQIAVRIKYTPVGTAGAADYLQITGVQLEEGSVATPFESRPYGVELALCQRYYEKSYPISVTPGTVSELGIRTFCNSASTNTPSGDYQFKVAKRTTPGTVTIYSPATGTAAKVRNESAGTDETVTVSNASENGFARVYGTTTTVDIPFRFHFTADAEL